MTSRSKLVDPRSFEDLFLFRLTRLIAAAGAPVIRICEGRYGITRREWRLICALALDGTMLSSALAQRIHLERGRTSKAISEMVEKGLLVRRPRPNDRRQVEIELTDAGRSIYDTLFPEVVRLNQQLLAALSEADIEQLDATLARLQASADRTMVDTELPKADRRRRDKTTPRLPGLRS
ncbi:MAG: MarR family transcriptional regulator [Rhodoferax sp.]|nr:MarR family transcriptional regulator [Rhodoferax sp.]MCB2007407.1 MarR family transcriptional regulator [Rhodoferax sp.]MCB2030868.1 MarR family transcriptional regulator [Rhodoferax sp.]MCB2042594.1 MarR family transcriptional regulator [Rhodoferax sp.]MCP5262107.1 MarR family transcriptional regulator [Rhodoferax sp.]